jgi:hypothetical protein
MAPSTLVNGTKIMLKMGCLSLVASMFNCGSVVVPEVADATIDAVQLDAPPPCSLVSRAYGEQGALFGDAWYAANVNGTKLSTVTTLSPLIPTIASEFTDYIQVQVWSGRAPFGTAGAPTPIVPGTYEIAEAQAQHASCSVCVQMGSAWNGTEYKGDFFAFSGRVVISKAANAVGEQWETELFDLVVKQVIYTPIGVSVIVNPGCETTIKHATFSKILVMP